MDFLIRRVLACVAGVLIAASLGGCATGMSRDQCAAADWRTIGYEDGLHGLPPDRIGAHRVACAKHQVAPDLAAYTEGRERGLRDYCQPRNGFRVGLSGGGYANVCPDVAEAGFTHGYRSGREIHDARVALRSTQTRLRGAREGLANTEAAMVNTTAEAVLPNVPTERRVWLASELVRLTQQRGDLMVRIDQLTAQAQQLAFNVQELERQSPFTL
jgi:Protein of unknown function (DUF2799)